MGGDRSIIRRWLMLCLKHNSPPSDGEFANCSPMLPSGIPHSPTRLSHHLYWLTVSPPLLITLMTCDSRYSTFMNMDTPALHSQSCWHQHHFLYNTYTGMVTFSRNPIPAGIITTFKLSWHVHHFLARLYCILLAWAWAPLSIYTCWHEHHYLAILCLLAWAPLSSFTLTFGISTTF